MTSSTKAVLNSHSAIRTVTVQESQNSQFPLAERAAKDSYGTIRLIAKEERDSA
jgi:hypothetical protein